MPPLAAVALGLAALQEQISLPEGSLHTGQEVEHVAAIRVDEALTLTGRIAQRSERQGFVISVIEFEIASTAGSRGARADDDHGAGSGIVSATVAPVERTLTQAQLHAYADASGDHNPIHVDPAFAADTPFGGTIAHGMLVLALIGEMMHAAFGDGWLHSAAS